MALLEDECWEALGWGEVEETLGRDVTDIVLEVVCCEALGWGGIEEPLEREVTDTVGEPEVVVEDDVCELPKMPAPVRKLPKAVPGPNFFMSSQHPRLPALLPAWAEQQKLWVNVPFNIGQGMMLLKLLSAACRCQPSVQVRVQISVDIYTKRLTGSVELVPFLQFCGHSGAVQLESVQPPRYIYPALPKQRPFVEHPSPFAQQAL